MKKIRKYGTLEELRGSNKGEIMYATKTTVKHKGSGKENMDERGENVIVFLGVSDGPNVSGIHLAGLGDITGDGQVKAVRGEEVYSFVDGSQSQTLCV